MPFDELSTDRGASDLYPTTDVCGVEGGKYVIAIWPGGTRAMPLPERGKITIGRGNGAALTIADESVSRLHAVIHVAATLAIEDLGSRNGTRVSGRELANGETHAVSHGAVIEIGRAIVLIHGRDVAWKGSSRHELASTLGKPSGEAMERLHRVVELVAPSDISVILNGETGVGKEVFAETIHRLSPRAARPFVAINCASISESLLESELFGHERGAFTGATQKKMGLLESAQGGTVFLDEIGEMPLEVQAKLLRALEKREITPVGSVTSRTFDARFLAATHRDLESRVEASEFREDLYFRLNGITLKIPPLRERTAEIESLAQVFLCDSAQRAGRVVPTLTPEALRKLRAYRWPGNIRELRNVIYRALIMCEGTEIRVEDIDLPQRSSGSVPPTSTVSPPAPGALTGLAANPNTLNDATRERERQSILNALEQSRGNQSKAALLLGVTRRALAYRMQVYEIRKRW